MDMIIIARIEEGMKAPNPPIPWYPLDTKYGEYFGESVFIVLACNIYSN